MLVKLHGAICAFQAPLHFLLPICEPICGFLNLSLSLSLSLPPPPDLERSGDRRNTLERTRFPLYGYFPFLPSSSCRQRSTLSSGRLRNSMQSSCRSEAEQNPWIQTEQGSLPWCGFLFPCCLFLPLLDGAWNFFDFFIFLCSVSSMVKQF